MRVARLRRTVFHTLSWNIRLEFSVKYLKYSAEKLFKQDVEDLCSLLNFREMQHF